MHLKRRILRAQRNLTLGLLAASVFSAKAAVPPLLWNDSTRIIVAPSNILGMTFGHQYLTNLVGYGLINTGGNLTVDTNTLAAVFGGGGGGSGDVTKVGTPVNNQIGVWTGDGTIEGDTALTFDTSTDTLFIAASGNIVFGAVTIFDDNSGTMTLSNIDAIDSTTESTFEAALDLQDLQGAVTDAQVPNSITVDQATLALTGDSATAFFSTGTLEEARIDSAIARDAEMALLYQPLDSDLTRLAGIGVGTEGDILYRDAVGWTNLARGTSGQILSSTSSSIAWSNAPAGGGDVISTANNNFTQTNNFAGPVNGSTITVNDVAYGSGWDGSTNVVTANAVYDKIQTIPSQAVGYVTSDQGTTSATAVNVTGMSFAIGTNEVWGVEFYAGVTVSGVAGAKVAINGPSGMTVGAQCKGNGSTPLIITALSTLTSALTTSATGAVTVFALCQSSSTAGTVQLQFASADGIVTATIKGNQTYFKATKLN